MKPSREDDVPVFLVLKALPLLLVCVMAPNPRPGAQDIEITEQPGP